MKKVLIVLAALAIAAPAFGAAGVDISANNICPGIAGANSDGGVLDCVSLAATGKNVRLYVDFIPAENISDLASLDGQLRLDLGPPGDLNNDNAGPVGGSFWNAEKGQNRCLEQNGGDMRAIGSKPQNGDLCGSSLQIREVFVDGGAASMFPQNSSSADIFFSVIKGGGFSATTAMRIFGFELRMDPAYAQENGGPCGSCTVPVCITVVKASPLSLSGAQTTTLTSSTGTAGVGTSASYNSGCAAVPTRARTWGQLKSLYR